MITLVKFQFGQPLDQPLQNGLTQGEYALIHSITLIPKSMDPQRVDDTLSNLIPAFKQAQGLHSLKISEGHLMSPGSPPAYSKVIEASFKSLEDFMAWVLLFYEVNEL